MLTSVDERVQLIATLGTVVIVLIGVVQGWLNKRKTDEAHADTKEIKEQVQNTHTTNLREDLDKVMGLVGLMDSIHKDVQQLAQRHDQAVEKHNQDVSRLWEALHKEE